MRAVILAREPVLTFVLSALVYALTLCPTVYVEGSGELIGAVSMLGTPHPTGYPLFCLFGRLVVVALPMGNTALEVNVALRLNLRDGCLCPVGVPAQPRYACMDGGRFSPGVRLLRHVLESGSNRRGLWPEHVGRRDHAGRVDEGIR